MQAYENSMRSWRAQRSPISEASGEGFVLFRALADSNIFIKQFSPNVIVLPSHLLGADCI